MRLQLATIVPPNEGAIPEPDRTIHDLLNVEMVKTLHASNEEASVIELRMASILHKVTAIHDLAHSATLQRKPTPTIVSKKFTAHEEWFTQQAKEIPEAWK